MVLDLPSKRYQVIVADPPWRYSFSRSKSRRVENHYPTMVTSDICDLPIQQIVDPAGCVLYLWVTRPKLEHGLRVLNAWGFKYVTGGDWNKDKIGMGYWLRDKSEWFLIGKVGKKSPPPPDTRIASTLVAPREEHSKKPAALQDHLDAAYPEDAKIELFARRARPGWDVWGLEAPVQEDIA